MDRLIAGFSAFRARHYRGQPGHGADLAAGQSPATLVIACSDSRVDPALLFDAEPGEIFVIRNVANLVPPYAPDGGLHGTSAAIEFAVRGLNVARIVILGHSGCGGVHALRRHAAGERLDFEFIAPWMQIVEQQGCGHAPTQAEEEQACLRVSLANLRTFPWIAEREKDGRLKLAAWWFDIADGALHDVRPDALRRLA